MAGGPVKPRAQQGQADGALLRVLQQRGGGGKRKKAEADDAIPCVLEAELTDREFRRNWARLIQKTGACPGLDPGRSTLWCAPNAQGRCA